MVKAIAMTDIKARIANHFKAEASLMSDLAAITNEHARKSLLLRVYALQVHSSAFLSHVLASCGATQTEIDTALHTGEDTAAGLIRKVIDG